MIRKLLLVSGIVASALYIATDVIAASIYPGYSYTSQTISELYALGAPSRVFVVQSFSLYALLVLLFAAGVWLAAAQRRALHVTAALLALYAFACIPFAPMHTREVLAAAGGTWTDNMHIALTVVDSLLLVSIIAVGSTVFGTAFRVYSLCTLVLVLGAGMFTGSQASAMEANLPTPWMGVSERIAVLGTMVWLATFAAALVVRQRATTATAPRRGGLRRVSEARG